MKQTLALILSLALALSLCLAGFAENMEGNTQEVLPDTAAPLVEENTPLSAETPAAENPPVDNPPVDNPLADNPPADNPPADNPPADNPPADNPPADNPPADNPPADNPPADNPPADNPPADNPPADSPPADSPPADNPPADNPPADNPPADNPPADNPPADNPPADNPPTESTPPQTAPTETTAPPVTAPPAPPVTESHNITKHPTSETVYEGGYAEFVARADNCINIIWHLQSSGGGSDILAQNAPITFPGLEVSGLGSERLALNRIPKELNDWRVRAEFVYLNGNSWSDPATITVLSQGLSTPTVLSNPKSASLSNGQSTSLQVSAQGSGSNTTLTYQWYQNTVDSNVGGKAILGATTASYVPEQVPGTVYYYCAVRSSDGTSVSAAAKTSCAAVSYPAAPNTQPSAAATVPVVTQPASAATLSTWGAGTTEQTLPSFSVPAATTPTRTPPKSNSLLVVIVAVIIVIAVMGVIAALVILKYYSDQDGERERPPRQKNEKPRHPSGQPPKHQPRYQPKEMPKQSSSREEDPEWDDLSDLDLSYYLDDEDDL